MSQSVKVIGGGLAGSEAAWQLAERGFTVDLYEMRPIQPTGAHVSDRLAELVCSNSLGSKLPDRATGILQSELKVLRSLLIACAEETALPAGAALAVDREQFAQKVTDTITQHPRIRVIREEVTKLPADVPTIVATGPLTSPALADEIAALAGSEYLYFYDALSPIVEASSIDMSIAFSGNRYERGESEEGDYVNCPFTREEYERFIAAIKSAPTIKLRTFEEEDPHFFEGCLPIEQMAQRGDETLAYGPMRPVGLRDPRTGHRPHAVVQLRRDNLAGTLYNIVGFQTNMTWPAQTEVLRLIPGLQNAQFVRLGQMHRNTFVNAPTLLEPTMQFRQRKDLYFAGQITGVEGYMGNVATGLLAAVNLARHLNGLSVLILPPTSMLGALCHYVSHADPKNFQPMKANLGILPDLLHHEKDKSRRKVLYAERAHRDLLAAIHALHDPYLNTGLQTALTPQGDLNDVTR